MGLCSIVPFFIVQFAVACRTFAKKKWHFRINQLFYPFLSWKFCLLCHFAGFNGSYNQLGDHYNLQADGSHTVCAVPCFVEITDEIDLQIWHY